jgi:uncharacterized damage-inducible protein DinB
MPALTQLTRLFAHAAWATRHLGDALTRSLEPPADAVREFAHGIAADTLWLARLTQRVDHPPVWPGWDVAEARAHAERTGAGYRDFLAQLDDIALAAPVVYTTTDGRPFATPAGEILLHVALHGQYHRGKVNLLLRQHGLDPAPVDYIAWVRSGADARSAPPR